jgi:RNA polymerase sigma factor (sigma-70 family)
MATLLERPKRRSDERLVRSVSGGDRQALGAIFERYQQELYRFCLGLLGEPQDAQDALQNTMVKALRALPGEEREIALRPWLYRIAHNEAIELRRGRRETQALDGHLLDARSSLAERAEQRERLEWVLKDLDDLPERQRSVLVMRELSGLDFAEIGAALGASGAVVRQALYEARRNLEQMDRGRSLRCETVARLLSDGDGRVIGRREIRAHLRKCHDCRQFRDRIQARKEALAGIAPLPAGAAASVLQGALGSAGGSGAGGGIAAAVGGGAVKSIGVQGVIKAIATIAAVAAVGTAEVERSSYGQNGADGAATARSSRSTQAARESKPRANGSASHRLRSAAGAAAGDGAAGLSAPDPAASRAGTESPRVLVARQSTARSGGGSTAGAVAPTAGATPGAPGSAPVASPPAPVGALTQTVESSPKAEEQSKSAAKAEMQGADAASAEAEAKPEHPAHPEHPTHPAHPAQSQKPVAEEASAEAGKAPLETATTPTPEAEEPASETGSAGSNGNAKGKEKKTQG